MNGQEALLQASKPLESAVPSQEPAKPSMNAARWRWLRLAVGVCLLTWLALGIGIVADVGFTPMLVLATLAAGSTEGLIWLTALLLGMNVYSARRHLWQRLLQRLHLN